MTDVPVLTVTQLTHELKGLVESGFPFVWVQGEVSNCTRAASGHVYLTLKDDVSQLRAVIWRNTASRLRFELTDGLDVAAAGPVQIYAARGMYQLMIEQITPQGIGALELAFRQLQQKLAAEGLFDAERKRALPRLPRRIAIVTSPAGAAIRDILQVIARRWPAARIIVLPVPVQGAGAARRIAAAIASVHRIPDVDVVIAGRGGGSMEDLWAFNDELVARAIGACPIPVVSAVGHEVDVSIADLVADRRALTPSEAGELIVPVDSEVRSELDRVRGHVRVLLADRAHRARTRLETLAAHRVLTHPQDRIRQSTQRTDEMTERLRRSAVQRLESSRNRACRLATSLDALSPLRVLSRGYSITTLAATGEIVLNASQVRPGDVLDTRLIHGRVRSLVESATDESPGPRGGTTPQTRTSGSSREPDAGDAGSQSNPT